MAILQPESKVANHYGHGLGRAAFIALHMTLALVCLATERTQKDATKQRLESVDCRIAGRVMYR